MCHTAFGSSRFFALSALATGIETVYATVSCFSMNFSDQVLSQNTLTVLSNQLEFGNDSQGEIMCSFQQVKQETVDKR